MDINIKHLPGRFEPGLRKGTAYPLVDLFRLLAAFLVIANHTSPFASFSFSLDILFARGLSRLAVPFFFLASGFFMFQKDCKSIQEQATRLCRFSLKSIRLYAIAVVIYLPYNLITGYFQFDSIGQILKDFLWNGTVYHLWYFPAVIIGSWIGWLLYRLPRAGGVSIAVFLYLFGVLGNRWEGLLAFLPTLESFYGILPSFLRETRNGIFFAPLFLLLGMIAADCQQPVKRKYTLIVFLVSLGFMLGETLLYRDLFSPQNDSMYVLLPVVSWCLFRLLISVRGQGYPFLRSLSMWIYILHIWPVMLLAAVRIRVSILQPLLSNSIVFFLLVCLLTLLAAIVFIIVHLILINPSSERAELLVDKKILTHNLKEMAALVPAGCKVMAVVKADAYGLGAVQVARHFYRQGVRAFAVATIEEGIQLRIHGIQGIILVLGYSNPTDAVRMWLFRLTASVVDSEHAKALSCQLLRPAVHLKIDTGMHRMGLPVHDEVNIAALYTSSPLRITGIYTHLSCADSLEDAAIQTSKGQIHCFENLVTFLHSKNINPGKVHLHSSYALINHPADCDYVRLGLSLYGGIDTTRTIKQLNLLEAMTLSATVGSVRTVRAGEAVGYCQMHTCKQDSIIATTTIGYADGIPRCLEKGKVLINGKKAPIVGRISMDQLAIDVSDVANISIGQQVIFMGSQMGNTITPLELATKADTIPNEVLAQFGKRIKRIYV